MSTTNWRRWCGAHPTRFSALGGTADGRCSRRCRGGTGAQHGQLGHSAALFCQATTSCRSAGLAALEPISAAANRNGAHLMLHPGQRHDEKPGAAGLATDLPCTAPPPSSCMAGITHALGDVDPQLTPSPGPRGTFPGRWSISAGRFHSWWSGWITSLQPVIRARRGRRACWRHRVRLRSLGTAGTRTRGESLRRGPGDVRHRLSDLRPRQFPRRAVRRGAGRAERGLVAFGTATSVLRIPAPA